MKLYHCEDLGEQNGVENGMIGRTPGEARRLVASNRGYSETRAGVNTAIREGWLGAVTTFEVPGHVARTILANCRTA